MLSALQQLVQEARNWNARTQVPIHFSWLRLTYMPGARAFRMTSMVLDPCQSSGKPENRAGIEDMVDTVLAKARDQRVQLVSVNFQVLRLLILGRQSSFDHV